MHLDAVPMGQAFGVHSRNSVDTDWVTSLAGNPDLCASAFVFGSRKHVRGELAVQKASAAQSIVAAQQCLPPVHRCPLTVLHASWRSLCDGE